MIILVLGSAILILIGRQDDCIRMVLFSRHEIAIRMVVKFVRMIKYLQDDRQQFQDGSLHVGGDFRMTS